MKKFLVTADLGYVVGHLRYGHFEGIVKAESEETLKEMMKKGSITKYLDIVVDDYSIDDYGDIGEYEYEEVEQMSIKNCNKTKPEERRPGFKKAILEMVEKQGYISKSQIERLKTQYKQGDE